MSPKKVSVVIPAYNAEKTILKTLDSVFKQTYPHLEIIVVNDGSTDNTLDILQQFINKISLISTVNKGVSHARNLGLLNASGDYIQYLDSDDLLMPEKIELQLEVMVKHNADIAYGNWQKFTEINNNEIILKEINSKSLAHNIEIELFSDFWSPPAALLYSKKIVDKIGGWKEWLPVIQDARYLLDASLKGGKFIHTPFLVAQYRTGQDNSLSSKSSFNFVNDCYLNAKDVWRIWRPEKNEAKKQAVINCLRYCINEFSILNSKLFYEAIDFLLEIEPNYIPEQPGSLQSLSKFFGYKNAEGLAKWKRRLRNYVTR